jgi:hypothetical protein
MSSRPSSCRWAETGYVFTTAIETGCFEFGKGIDEQVRLVELVAAGGDGAAEEGPECSDLAVVSGKSTRPRGSSGSARSCRAGA